MPKSRSMAQIEWKKHPYIFFSIFDSKLNKFEQKKSEKMRNGILLPKLRSMAQIEWKKHPYYFFLLLVQK